MSESLQSQLGLDPTAIVLAKVKGYPAWPAMVLDYDLLPENIKQLKPKSVKQTKKGPPIVAVPVRFFSDNTYIWIKSIDLKLLSDEAIAAFLLKRSRKSDPLVQAYTLAQNPPDMAEFIRWGSQGPPTQMPESADEDLDLDEPPQKKLKLKFTTKKSANPKRELQATQSKSKAKSKTKAAVKKESEDSGDGFADYAEFEKELDEEASSGFDSDWGLDEPLYNYDTGDYVFEDKEEQKRFVHEFPCAADLALTLQHYTKFLDSVHRQITPALLLDEFVEKDILTPVREINKLLTRNELPLVVFTRSKLFRSLLLVLHKPKEVFTLRAVRGAVQSLCDSLELAPCEITLADLVMEETPPSEEVDADNAQLVEALDEATVTSNGTTFTLDELAETEAHTGTTPPAASIAEASA